MNIAKRLLVVTALAGVSALAHADIAEVARHLNDTIYHFPQTADRVGMAPRRATP